jgi:hypothetical protein
LIYNNQILLRFKYLLLLSDLKINSGWQELFFEYFLISKTLVKFSGYKSNLHS